MAFSSLDVFNAGTAAQEKSTATLGGLLQNAYQDASAGIQEAGRINQGVMQSAINAQQLAIDTWYKQQEVQRQQIEVGQKAQELQLYSRRLDLEQDYHQQEIDLGKDKLKEKEVLATRAQANKLGINALNDINTGLKIHSANLKSAILVDQAAVSKIIGKGSSAMSYINPTQDDIIAQKTQLPILQDRIAKNMGQLERLNANLDIVASTSAAMAGGGDPEVLLKQLSSNLGLKDLHSSSYPVETGEPITNEQADVRDGVMNVADDSDALQTYGDTQDPTKNFTSRGQPIKMSAQEAQSRIDAAVAAAGEQKVNEKSLFPGIQNMVATMTDLDGQNYFKNIQTNMLKEASRSFYDEGLNSNANNQKLNHIDANWIREFQLKGGSIEKLNEVKRDFTNFGKWTADGSLPQSGLVPKQYSGKFISDSSGTTNTLSGYEKTQLGTNLIDNYFEPKQNPNNVSANGRYSPLSNTGTYKLDKTTGEVDVGPDVETNLSPDDMEKQYLNEKNKKFLEAQTQVKGLMFNNGTLDKDNILAKLKGTPDRVVIGAQEYDKIISKYDTTGGESVDSKAEREEIYKAKTKKIQQLLKPGKEDKKGIYKVLLDGLAGTYNVEL